MKWFIKDLLYLKNTAVPYLANYSSMVKVALDTVDPNEVENAIDTISEYAQRGQTFMTFGNGGSAAIADHMACDLNKGIRQDSNLQPHVISLVSNGPLISAIANDTHYDQVFAKQIEWASAFTGVLGISSSGKSPNIVKAFEAAKKRGFISIAMVGFDGGEVLRRKLADIILWVDYDNYGVVEDCHHILMHVIAQQIRLTNSSDPDKIRL